LVAYSSLFAGAGVFAGQGYHCAVTRFPGDKLYLSSASPDVPYCDSCPPGFTLGYDHCKTADTVAATTNVSLLVTKARERATASTIDSLADLASRRVFLYRGLNDTTYNGGSVRATTDFVRAFLPDSAVQFEESIQSEHLLPGINPHLCSWEEWAGPDNCTYDGAYHVLSWIHGASRLAGGRSKIDSAALWSAHGRTWDQRPFWDASRDAGLAESGALFVPPDCHPDGHTCTVHMFLHGCDVDDTWSTSLRSGGASTNGRSATAS
jgi:poly(3-hydroxybutyrate) depolymerase